MNGSPTDVIANPWVRVSERRYVHRSGACIERREYPTVPGWYLIPDPRGEALHRFEPIPQGCDDAFIAFSARYSP
jgi:hypothetical protein